MPGMDSHLAVKALWRGRWHQLPAAGAEPPCDVVADLYTAMAEEADGAPWRPWSLDLNPRIGHSERPLDLVGGAGAPRRASRRNHTALAWHL